MPAIPINVVQDVGSLTEAFNELAILQKQLRYVINGNVDFENVRARSIKAENIEVGTLTADEIAANTITADKMSVTELSAITANMGTITAGLLIAVNIIGSYIATANGTFPRCEMSATDNLFAAYSEENVGIRIIPFFTNDKPALVFQDGDTSLGVLTAPDELQLTAYNALRLRSGNGPVILSTESLDGIQFDSWGELRNQATGHNLQQDLNAKANSFSGYSGSFSTGTNTVNVSNGIITSVT